MSSPTSALAGQTVHSHHGKLTRGLLSTSSSRLYQGRFGRMFRSLPAASYGATDEDSRAALKVLGERMTSGFDKPKDGHDAEEGGVPALYTYLAQFIDHDITFDPVSTLVRQSDPDALTDFRTPAFDLDNLYGRGPDDQPYLYKTNRTLLLGDPIGHDAYDLPRNSAKPRRALIGDPRNDENSIISQLQGLFLRFHNHVAKDNPTCNLPDLQRIVRFHYQRLILEDFLPRIVQSNILDDLKTNCKWDRAKLKYFRWKNEPFMPVEFSVAAYRFGHSMVRPGYRLNDKTILPIFPILPGTNKAVPKGLPHGLTGFREMAKERVIDWARFVDTEIRSYGAEDENARSTTQRLQFAYRIDTSLVYPLQTLPPDVVSDPPPSLPQRNLIRSFELGLPSGQAVARAMGVVPLEDDQIVIGKAVDAPKHGDVLGTIQSIKELEVFKGNCPLWTYILAEAARYREEVPIPVTDARKITTPKLGCVGGRIVAEVFLGLLFGDGDSMLNLDPNWDNTVTKPFQLKDFVNYALAYKED